MNTIYIGRRFPRRRFPGRRYPGRRWPRHERARMDPRWVVVLGAMLALFAASFAIGHATKGGSARAEAASSGPLSPAVASVPARLASAPALGLGAPVVVRPVHHAKAQPAGQAVSAPAQPLSGEAPRQQAPVSRPVQSAPAPAPRPEPAPVVRPPAPKPAPVHTSAPATHSAPSPSGGGSFESSG
jgi:hypothetical protein